MARAASAPKKEVSMEEALWKSADKLRGSVEPAEYKHLSLIHILDNLAHVVKENGRDQCLAILFLYAEVLNMRKNLTEIVFILRCV